METSVIVENEARIVIEVARVQDRSPSVNRAWTTRYRTRQRSTKNNRQFLERNRVTRFNVHIEADCNTKSTDSGDFSQKAQKSVGRRSVGRDDPSGRES